VGLISQDSWARVGKWLATLMSGIVVVVVGDWLLSPTGVHVSATVSFGSVHYPPRIAEQLEAANADVGKESSELRQAYRETHSALRLVEIRSLFPAVTDLDARKAANETADKVAEYIQQHLRALSEKWDYFAWFGFMGIPSKYDWLARQSSWPKGYWAVVVRNSGDRSALGVSLHLPGVTYFLIERKGMTPTHARADEVIELGSMKPQDEVQVIGWTQFKPSEYDVDEITLKHESGVGTVKGLYPVGGAWYGLACHWRFWVLQTLCFAVLVYCVVMFVANWRAYRRRSQSAAVSEAPALTTGAPRDG